MNKVEIRGGLNPQGTKILLNGEELKDCTRLAVWAEAEGGWIQVTFTILAEVEIEVDAVVEMVERPRKIREQVAP